MRAIELHGVSWQRNQKPILRDIDWVVDKNDHWLLMGVNGSGKTTLLNVINGYIWPTRGSVEVLGQKFGHCDLREVRQKIGWVNSAFAEQMDQFYPNEPVLDVVISGKFASISLYDAVSRADEERATELLRLFGCENLAAAPLHTLSQGERQRVVLARAWMANPELLILDEPCTGLDLLARERLLQSVQRLGELADGPTLIYVTHHVEEVLPIFNRTLMLQDGTALFSGTTDEVLTSGNLSQAFGIEVEVGKAGSRYFAHVAG